ncbi:F-box/FBD/LRR-repeat protein [Camellia lanceoleosa]|uniref:F-box/FBD/LRR-repeat protein n=1 Tax=Camellia lanceoleosa TaxID=1840588 RepID=A0ACC0H1A9_9ERIC|nr:F-box/FBD/LRR-repeat protein [Camellia lanceoleosa]
MCAEDNFKLPPMLFTSKILVVLKLVLGIFLEVPASVWLPSLKILHLEREKEDSFQSLFLGCPALEEMYLWTLDTKWVLNIFVPTRKSLTFICPRKYSRDGIDDQGCKVVFNTPKLEELDLIDYVSEDHGVENLPSLLTAMVNVLLDSITRPNNYHGHIYKLLSSMKNVKFLDAFLSFPTDDNTPVLPTLHNLSHLTLTT